MNEKHHIDALALVEGQKYHYTGFSAGARGFETDYFGYNNLKAGGTVKYGDVTSFQNENRRPHSWVVSIICMTTVLSLP